MLTSPVRVILGIVVIVFFKSMAALFDPDHRRGETVKWGIVSYTVAMFSLVTVGTAAQFGVQSISYIDNREYRGGPLGYQLVIYSEAIDVIQNITFSLSVWLADGFLVSRLLDAVRSFMCLTPAPPALSLLCYLLR